MYEKQIDELVERIRDDFNPKAIIIFGSVARGTADEFSDIDVDVIMDTNPSWTQRTVTIRRSLRNIRIPLDVLWYSHRRRLNSRGGIHAHWSARY